MKRWIAQVGGRRIDVTWLFRALAFGWWAAGAVFSFAAVPVLMMLALGDVVREFVVGR